MDWLREKLRSVYGGQVACYSGRGGEIWDGQGWQRVSKEQIKHEFARENVKILLGTDAMSEGLNLQTCGMMINYDMPWNPMRVEQRIGRIDRIEQRYPEVWIRNYFYEDTVEANVYKALEGRITWFETVVGTLQPILARVARLIQETAMAAPNTRPQRLADALEDIKRQLDEQQVDVLDLDKWLALDEDPPAKAGSIPVTRHELERALLTSPRSRDLFRAHGQIAGAYWLTLDDHATAVTFEQDVFAAHPEELRLLAYGETTFHRLLAKLCPAAEPQLPPWVARFTSEDPPLRGWWRLDGQAAIPRETLAALVESLSAKSVPVDPSARSVAFHSFERQVAAIKTRELTAAALRHKAKQEALRERGRQLLLHATYLDVALSGAEAPLLGPEAVINLRRHGFPFSALIAAVTIRGIEPSITDPLWEEAQGLSAEALRRRFEEAKKRAKELVAELQAIVKR